MKKRIALLLALLLAVAMLQPGMLAYADGGAKGDIASAKTAVVKVCAETQDGSFAQGTAFGIGKEGELPEYFITNAHCVFDEEGEPVDSIFIALDNKAVRLTKFVGVVESLFTQENVEFLRDTKVNNTLVVQCEVIYAEESQYPDIAILKAARPIEGHTTLPLRRTSEDVKDGDKVYAIGFPGAADALNRTVEEENISFVDDMGNRFTGSTYSYYLSADSSESLMTPGEVSKKSSGDGVGGTNLIFHTAPIDHGNSGGPLLDESGAVVGINTYGTGGNGQNIAIYIDYIIPILETKGIAFDDADAMGRSAVNARNIILIAVMAAVVAAAVVLILTFSKRSKKYVEDEKRQEASQLRIQGVAGYYNGRRFEIPARMSFGRAPDCSMRFPEKTPGVSGHHCELIRGDSNRLFLKDVGSSNGTAVNGGSPIPANQMVELHVGDRFYLGSENEGFLVCYKGGKLSVD